ncbi:bifunctional methylenetetrahydrofolate dehydrogenase/methenyltetrahydrofolate cyclohydrolase FolD [Candidatus Liberibacter americanus]|uniref:Bifunctional protein FolD n=1 Tax=Candidatus Liberibacter americanus str. Sao Paulo TaxID=1261131 RepID=U6B3Y7_9HYPH|nr:bifunctional methylenetetrahydrofolate dehydrogenase/methenyltetrahydrofolate cyclohydrolase FolD [Candidatus Liberibacter americanus]AHA27769.1 5,10-methylene-tetrahydrofolate dehydrogenase/Methenyl tetrahydrofolate cyclohydrolase [Candidatus Liberibacter americanus str. Sao Paulo]EMS36154.1 methylenetetrahydrofolate dehydrogenase/cyclohydrolase protein [Candidatus Liberibacter americanus PW_SP]
MGSLIDGKVISSEITKKVADYVEFLKENTGIKVGLAVIIVGNDPASCSYVTAKTNMAKKCGFHSIQYNFPINISQVDLERSIVELNQDNSIHGILVQLPLPSTLCSNSVIQSILPEKDVDGLHILNAGKILVGDFATGIIPCTPAGSMFLIHRLKGYDLSGQHAVVIGRSNLFGKPVAQLLLAKNATVTIAHSKTNNLSEICRSADILIVAVGKPYMVKSDWVKEGALIIDVGINRINSSELGKSILVGDVDPECREIAGAITPVPGGVGPMTIAMLMFNTVISAYRSAGMEPPNFDI